MKDLHHIRSHYEGEVLDESIVSSDPMEQFEVWFSEAQPGMETPNAMILATADRSGAPSARVVLLKSFSPEGFTFYTNYESDKGKQLEENPQASLLFYWPALHRQVRIEGAVKKVDPLQSQKYFSERPRESQVSAWASQQSHQVTSKKELEERCKKLEHKYEGREIPCPPFWGGYCLQPQSYEFWQGQAVRLHDRVVYEWDSETKHWIIKRLAP